MEADPREIRKLVRVTAAAVCLATALGLPAPAWALDVNVTSTTTSQVYEVRGGAPDLFLRRRRVAERLSLQLMRILPRESETGYDGPRLSVSLSLRVDADFGAESLESRPSSELWFVPGYDPYAVDLMIAQLRVEDLFSRTTDLRAGRLLMLDPTGFGAIDGLEVRVRLPFHLELRAASGVEVVAGQHLSSGTFAPDGVIRQRRDDFDPSAYPEVEEPPTRVVVSGGASLVGLDFLAVDFAFRQGMVPGDEVHTSYQRLAGMASFVAGPVQGGVLASGDTALALVDELAAEVAVRPLRWLLVGVGARYDAPVFDTDSIFVAFWAEPAFEGDLRVEVQPVSGLRLGGSGLVRYAGSLFPEEGEELEVDALRYGGQGYARIRFGRYLGEVRARVADGFGGRRAGVDGRFSALLPGDRVSFDLRGTVLGLERDIAPYEHLLAVGYVVGATYRMSPEARILFELEHNYSHALGQQLRFLAMLDLGFWI